MTAVARFALYVAIVILSLVAIASPAARGPLRLALLPLYLCMGGHGLWLAWRTGELQRPLGELMRHPPHTSSIELLAYVLGAIALTLSV
jgi:disulfide bond formation protein DsbB